MREMSKIHYCPVTPAQQQFGLYITCAGYESTGPGEAYPHENHPSDYYFTWKNGRIFTDLEYQLLYIRNGRGTIEFKRGKAIAVYGGCAIILRPGEWHRYRPNARTGWSEAYIGIGGEYLRRIIAEPFFDRPPIIIRTESDGRFKSDLIALIDEIQSDSAERPYSLALKAAALISTLCENIAIRSEKTAHDVAVRRASLHIAHHLGDVIDFQRLANELGMGYSLFRRCFRKCNGLSPLEYQLALRKRRAMNLLVNSRLPIAQIARETGFRSPAYFAKFFHEKTGLSPTDFRAKGHNPEHLTS